MLKYEAAKQALLEACKAEAAGAEGAAAAVAAATADVDKYKRRFRVIPLELQRLFTILQHLDKVG